MKNKRENGETNQILHSCQNDRLGYKKNNIFITKKIKKKKKRTRRRKSCAITSHFY